MTKSCFDFYRSRLPLSEQHRVDSYKRDQDRLAALAGKALLMLSVQQMGISADWSRLQRNAYGRPYLEDCPALADFNISHSGGYVAVAISTLGAVGIDIEAVSPVQVDDFEQCFTPGEWRMIRDSGHPLEAFFTRWSIKEAVIKAVGKGLSIPLAEVHTEEGYARIGTTQYAYERIAFRDDYRLVVAAPQLPALPVLPVDQTAYFDWDG